MIAINLQFVFATPTNHTQFRQVDQVSRKPSDASEQQEAQYALFKK